MLKKEIEYKDFFGETQKGTFYFHLTETELVEYEADHATGGGVANMLKRLVDIEDPKQLLTEFQNFILMSYGERSADGQYFDKSPELTARFKNHAAFNALFLEVASSADSAADFFLGVLPEEYVKQIREDEPGLVAAAFQPPTPPTNS